MTPDEFTNKEFFIEVGDGHELYVHDWGNPKAKTPILFLHGGPGSSAKDKHKAGFDPEKQRVIFHDQRASGRSLPYGSLEHNTTQDLVEDIEKIAVSLKLKQFVITGGSWGSCLALAYGLKYPKRVKAMVLSGIFAGSQDEIGWLSKGRFEMFFPDTWRDYLQRTPKSYRDNPSAYHFSRILGNDPRTNHTSGFAYASLERSIMSLDDRHAAIDPVTFDSTGIRTEVHYMSNGCFMPDRYIVRNARKLTMPIWLVQGRYDMVCPPQTAYALHQKLPNSHLVMTTSGHSAERETWNIVRTILLQMSGQ